MKNKLFKGIAAVLCALIAATAFAACGGSSSSSADAPAASAADANANSIVGKWEYNSGGYTYDFKDDGTGTYDVSGKVMKFTYEAKDGKLSLLYEGNTSPLVLDYSIDGNTLNVKDSNGHDTLYTKK